jgi:hypothetical protein
MGRKRRLPGELYVERIVMNRLLVVIIVSLSLLSISFAEQNQNSFGIYLIEKDATDLNNVMLSSTAIITDADIMEYNWASHSIILADKAFQTMTMSERKLYGKSSL